MYKFDINVSKKLLEVTVEGFFTPEEAGAYLNEFQQTIKKITPSGYSLFVNGSGQKVVTANLFDELQQAVDFYLSGGFKKVIVALPNSATAGMQIKRLNGFDKIEIVKTPAEAHALV
ncbi:hypothetical protein MHI18_11200 [Peribacillus sp. FSL H8-0477]|uniref:hypothetical protein n=1 Tax=Peribacillus sp. FSL H8-0477 TaxID=2921388 RepID=UPI0030F6A4DB